MLYQLCFFNFFLFVHLNYIIVQALPIFLDMIFNPYVAIVLSVTFVLAFGEVRFFKLIMFIILYLMHVYYICSCFYYSSLDACQCDAMKIKKIISILVYVVQVIPQAICTRYGLAVGANFVWLVRILMLICYPVAYPIGKVISISKKSCFHVIICFRLWTGYMKQY